ncbi:MAG: isocitrate lyase/phosphoenolpyruvate mutase family protein [Gemmatimonadaceae bacterium]
MNEIETRRVQFRELHTSGCFLIPNPWDVGSARLLAHLGFKALATTSSGFAWSNGMPDNKVTLPLVLEHLRDICAAVDIPVNADFEGGFATEPDAVFRNVTTATSTGICGISIEDSTGSAENPLFDFTLSVERMCAARNAIDESAPDVLLTGRSEGFIAHRPDLGETIRRLAAYGEAGADCLYAPGIKSLDEIATIVRELAPKPINVLVNSNFTTVSALADIGVRRISVGGALARTAYSAFVSAAQEIAGLGTFDRLANRTTSTDFDSIFG